MSLAIFLAITAIVVVLLGLKWNNIRTKMAFLLISLGIFFLLMVFLFATGNGVDLDKINEVFSVAKIYFLWVKSALTKVFEMTGKIIDFNWIKNTLVLIK